MVLRHVMIALLWASVVGTLTVTLSCTTAGASLAHSPPQGVNTPTSSPHESLAVPSIAAPSPGTVSVPVNSPPAAASHIGLQEAPEVVVAFPDVEPPGPADGIESKPILPLPQPPLEPATVAPKTGGGGSTEGSSASSGPVDLPTPPARGPSQSFSAPGASATTDAQGTAPSAGPANRAKRRAPIASDAAARAGLRDGAQATGSAVNGAPAVAASPGATFSPAGDRLPASTGGGVAVSVAPPSEPILGNGGSTAVSGMDPTPPPKQAPDGRSSQTVYARPGDQITVALDGAGWIFTGNGDWKSGLQYLSRSLDSKGTTFVFQAETFGDYSLSFLKQDLATGATTTKIVKVSVLSDADFARAIAGAGAASSSSPNVLPGGGAGNGSGNYTQADELYQDGFWGEALAAYKENWAPGNPAINERIANLAFRLKSYDDAKAFWRQNLGPNDGVYRELAVAGLMKTAAATHDVGQLRLLLFQSTSVTQVPIRTELLAAARFLVENGTYELAAKYLNEYLSRYAGEQGADEAYYLLGTMYQDATPMQDARKAREYYEKITDLYPTSRYYQRAMNNIIYLNRHFFEIR